MKIIYTIWNYDIDEPIMASTDESLLKEFMCDIFMEDYANLCNGDIYDQANTPTYEMIRCIADDEWDNNVDYYSNYIRIISAPMI